MTAARRCVRPWRPSAPSGWRPPRPWRGPGGKTPPSGRACGCRTEATARGPSWTGGRRHRGGGGLPGARVVGDRRAGGLELVQARGLAPEVIVSEGGPRPRWSAAGAPAGGERDEGPLRVRRGAGRRGPPGGPGLAGHGRARARSEFLGRVGTGALVEQARRSSGVLTTVLATTDKLRPGGDLTLPGWASGEAWHHLGERAEGRRGGGPALRGPWGWSGWTGSRPRPGLMLPGDLRDAPLRAI